ncbi:MAG: SAM-dependent methyltransferase [Burkholderiales bacterium PBB1]|nr:MAG: SAM-dependent methyltransferase [Burkholderiales bacterium PBB1]
MTPDPRQHSPSAERNRVPILAQLQRVLPPTGIALEIASGTGQHAAHFAAGLPGWLWQPTDAEPLALASIDAWCDGLANVLPAVHLDVLAAPSVSLPAPVDAVFCANMLHIAPWSTCLALMQLAAHGLSPEGRLVLYGPYLEEEVPTAPGNLAFDADLRERNPAWGLRRRADVLAQAHAVGLRLRERVAMPANNLLLVLERTVPSSDA